jgi:hypothetical protein
MGWLIQLHHVFLVYEQGFFATNSNSRTTKSSGHLVYTAHGVYGN